MNWVTYAPATLSRDGARSLARFVHDKARCAACEKPPDRFGMNPREDIGSFMFFAKCHGSVTTYMLGQDAIEAGQYPGLWDWAHALFPLDASPDMRELLAYNRGVLPNQKEKR